MPDAYDASIEYLRRLVAIPTRRDPEAVLSRTALLLRGQGDPQARFPALHVTGSAGKGSTATMASAILRAAGYRVGLFTSPHLHDYTERIQIDGNPIGRGEWVEILERLRPEIERVPRGESIDPTLGRPTLLEVLWPLAASYFAERQVDVAVVEVGMGGRFDATRLLRSSVGIVTSVSLEHQDRLGQTIGEIAYNKAGIAKPEGILVAAVEAEALPSILDACREVGAQTWTVGPVGRGTEVEFAGENRDLNIRTPRREYHSLDVRPLGPHQRSNAACAVAAIDALEAVERLRVSSQAVGEGLAGVVVPARLEWVDGEPPVLLDGAHNAAAAAALARTLEALFPDRPIGLLLGILGDKDIDRMVEVLAPLAAFIIVSEPPWVERAGAGQRVVEQARRHGANVEYIPHVPQALDAARSRAATRSVPLVVTGSFMLVGAVRSLLL